MEQRSHYDLLGVARDASPAEVRSGYRRRSRQIHPDRNPAPGAHAEMARLNAAYAVLSDPLQREAYDRELRRHAPAAAPRPPAAVPQSGRGSLQPDRLPDWYEFLDLHMNASSGEVIAALDTLGDAIRMAGYASEDEGRLLLQLRRAAETLANPRIRAVYDAALCGTPPPAGQYLDFHADLYSFLGVSRRASVDRIAEQVTELSGRLRPGTAAYREVESAWRILRDPDARARYDEELIAQS